MKLAERQPDEPTRPTWESWWVVVAEKDPSVVLARLRLAVLGGRWVAELWNLALSYSAVFDLFKRVAGLTRSQRTATVTLAASLLQANTGKRLWLQPALEREHTQFVYKRPASLRADWRLRPETMSQNWRHAQSRAEVQRVVRDKERKKPVWREF